MASQCVFDLERGGMGAATENVAPPVTPYAPATDNVVRPRAALLRTIGRLLFGLPRPAWLVLDAVIIWVALVQGYAWFGVAEHYQHAQAWLSYGVFAFSLFVCSLVFGLNERSTLVSRWRIITRILLTTAVGCLLAYAIIYVFMYLRLSRRVVALTVVTYLVFGTTIRLFASIAVQSVKRRVLIVGQPQACAAFMRRFDDNCRHAHEVIGFVHNPDMNPPTRIDGHDCLGTTQDLVRICAERNIQDIVVCNGSARNPEVMDWMLPCLRMGCRVTNEATFYETAAGRILVDEITPEWFLFSDLKSHCDEYAMLKRVFDIAVSVVGLLVSLPLYPLLAVAIRLEDGGPVFYSQERVGRGGRVFKLWKFRTMRTNAENGESRWASPNDPRVTRVGRILRRTRLDEFPQFYNILVGDMSVVGPRPERPDIVAELRRHVPYWSERNLVNPGLTGWAQISFRYGNTVDDAKRKLQYDFYYLKHMSLELDIIVLFRTLGTFVRGAC